MVGLVDTHNHFYAEAFDTDRREAISRSKESGVHTVLMPNIDINSVSRMHDLEDEFPDMLKSMMGLHPCDVKSDYKDVLQELGQWFDKRSYVGVGEVGMDLYWDRSTQAWQEEALLIQLEWAKLYNLPLSLHTRSATQEVIQLLKPFKGQIRGIFHCFSESMELANEIIKLGFKLGIGGVVTFKKAGIREVVSQIDLAHLVLETDSPYLAPTPFRGKRNEPAYVKLIAEEVAQLKGLSLEEVAAQTTANARDVFGL